MRKLIIILALIAIPLINYTDSVSYYLYYKWDNENSRPILKEPVHNRVGKSSYYWMDKNDDGFVSKVIRQNAYGKSLEEYVFYYDNKKLSEYKFKIGATDEMCKEPIEDEEIDIEYPVHIAEFSTTGNIVYSYNEFGLIAEKITTTNSDDGTEVEKINYHYDEYAKLAEKHIDHETVDGSYFRKWVMQYSKSGRLLSEFGYNADDVHVRTINYEQKYGENLKIKYHYDAGTNLIGIERKETDSYGNMIEHSYFDGNQDVIESHRLRYDDEHTLYEEVFTYNSVTNQEVQGLGILDGKHFVFKYDCGDLYKVQVFDYENNEIVYIATYEHVKHKMYKVTLKRGDKRYVRIVYFNKLDHVTDDIQYNEDGSFDAYYLYEYDGYGNVIYLEERDQKKKMRSSIRKDYDASGLITKYSIQNASEGFSAVFKYDYYLNKSTPVKITKYDGNNNKVYEVYYNTKGNIAEVSYLSKKSKRKKKK